LIRQSEQLRNRYRGNLFASIMMAKMAVIDGYALTVKKLYSQWEMGIYCTDTWQTIVSGADRALNGKNAEARPKVYAMYAWKRGARVEKSTDNEQKCGNCWYAVKRSPSDIAYWGFAYKYIECTATDKTLNIYKDKDDICDKGKYRAKDDI